MVYFSLAFEIAKSKLKSSLHKTEKKNRKIAWVASVSRGNARICGGKGGFERFLAPAPET